MTIEHITKITITEKEAEILHKAERLLDDIHCDLYDRAGYSIDSYNDIFDILNNNSSCDIMVEGY